jgi:chromatin assembly factor 1 subunit B
VAICVRFCPKLFQKSKAGFLDLPYTIIFAIGTHDSVLLYSTESLIPLCVVGNLHYQILNDLSWLEDSMLAVASSDGYCSFIKFEEKELGIVIKELDGILGE